MRNFPLTNLSPAAQAVLTAATQKLYCLDPEDVPLSASEYGGVIAAALCALAARINGADAIRQDILDIADELEAQ
jgi:hypothetical protein